MNDYEDDLLPQNSSAQQRNRLLIEDPDDAYVGSGKLLPPPRYQGRANARPLIEEEEKEAPQSSSALTDKGKANLAAYTYHQNKVRGLQQPKKPWKRGMPYSQATLDTFDASTPYEKKMFGGISNPRQAANLDAEDVRPAPKGFWGKLGDVLTGGGTFKKLFGQKTTEERADKRQEWKNKRQEMIAANGGKRTWMQKLFGAYKKKPSMSARAMGIKSTNAPMGESSGWADQLIEASKAGRLGEGGPSASQQLLDAEGGQGQSQADQSFEPVKDGEDKQVGAEKEDDDSSIDMEEEEKELEDPIVDETNDNKDDGESNDEDDESDEEKEDPHTQFQNFMLKQVMSKMPNDAEFWKKYNN